MFAKKHRTAMEDIEELSSPPGVTTGSGKKGSRAGMNFFGSEDGDDFSSPDISDIIRAQKVACGQFNDASVPNARSTVTAGADTDKDATVGDSQTQAASRNNVIKRTRSGPVTRHVSQALDCDKCRRTREGRMLHALLQMEDSDKVAEGGLTSGEDAVPSLALMSAFPAWHMSLGDEKCDILQSAIEDRVEEEAKRSQSQTAMNGPFAC